MDQQLALFWQRKNYSLYKRNQMTWKCTKTYFLPVLPDVSALSKSCLSWRSSSSLACCLLGICSRSRCLHSSLFVSTQNYTRLSNNVLQEFQSLQIWKLSHFMSNQHTGSDFLEFSWHLLYQVALHSYEWKS